MQRRRRETRNPKKKIGTMDLILVIVGVSLLAFTIAMVYLFMMVGSIPDTLCTCVFSALGGECGVMAWIKTTKERNQDRKWIVQDRQEEQELMKELEDTSNV